MATNKNCFCGEPTQEGSESCFGCNEARKYIASRNAEIRNVVPRVTTEERADEALNVLPPVYANGCFGLGEPISHDENTGAALRDWYAKIGGKWWYVTCTRNEAEMAFATLRKIDNVRNLATA